EGRRRDVGRGGDLLDGGRLEALRQKEIACRCVDPRAQLALLPLTAAFGGDSGGGGAHDDESRDGFNLRASSTFASRRDRTRSTFVWRPSRSGGTGDA